MKNVTGTVHGRSNVITLIIIIIIFAARRKLVTTDASLGEFAGLVCPHYVRLKREYYY